MSLHREIDLLDETQQVVLLDSVTNFTGPGQDPRVMAAFLDTCKQLSRTGKTIIIVIHSDTSDEQLLNRLRMLCNNHVILTVEKFKSKLVHTLRLVKANHVTVMDNPQIYFQIVEDVGIQMMPMSKVQV